MTAYPISTFIQSFVEFQNMNLEMQMKLKDDVLMHIYTYETIFLPLR